MNMKYLLVLILLPLAGCDAIVGKFKALGGKATIRCYSAELLIYEGRSTGKVQSSAQSDGYYFIDEQRNFYGDTLALLLQLIIEYEDVLHDIIFPWGEIGYFHGVEQLRLQLFSL